MFNGIWLIAKEPLSILGRDVQVGERFELSRTQSGALLVMGQARISADQTPPAKEVAPAPRRRGRPRKTETPQMAVESPETEAEPSPRRYRRRDLEAEP